MDPSLSNVGGGGGGGGGVGGDGDGVSVRSKYTTFMNTFLWYLFQTLTLSSMLLMALSIYWTFSTANIQGICVISIGFSIISPSFIIPKLPTLAAMVIPIIQLYKNVYIQVLNIVVWLVFGCLYPFPANILCYCLIACVRLLKLYGTDGESSSFRLIGVIGRDAFGISFFVKQYGTGRWIDSSTRCALLGLFVVTLLAHYLPPLVKPEKKKMMNEIEAILTEVVASEKKKKVNVDHVVNVAETPILGSGTKSLLETM